MPATTAANNSSTQHSSSTAACSLPDSSSLPSLDAIIEELITLQQDAKAIETRRKSLSLALDQLVEEGAAEEQIAWGDYKLTRRQRKSYTYPDYISEEREQLRAREQLSVALGEATLNVTTFWELRSASKAQGN